MCTVTVPDWNAQGVIPPIDVVDPTSANRSPYRVSLTDFVLRFDVSVERRSILKGYLNYRAALHAAGMKSGFQWINGSFLERVEVIEARPPNDVDLVTFYRLDAGLTQADVKASNPDLFDHIKAKGTFHVDAYLVSLDIPAENLVEQCAYWYSVWSHRRNEAWKGYVQIDLAPHNDPAAMDLLKGPLSAGGTP